MDPRKVESIERMTVDKEVGAVRRFLGCAQFYRRWIPGFSSMAAPLTDLMKKGTNVTAVWAEEHDAAVGKIKAALTAYPCLRQFDPTQPVVLLVDASKVGLGGCMAQYHEGSLCPVSYSSHRLTQSERLYPITELEGLAILHTVRCHRHFLINNPFTVRCLTDHKPLTWVRKVDTASGRLARWMMELANYDFRIEYIPGKVNDVADALSRLQLWPVCDSMNCPRVYPGPCVGFEQAPCRRRIRTRRLARQQLRPHKAGAWQRSRGKD